MTVFRGQAQFGKPTVSDKPGYRGPGGTPIFDRGPKGDYRNQGFRGSRGGAVVWGMEEAFVPRGRTSDQRLARLRARRETLTRFEVMELAQHDEGDPDGFAVFGRYPAGFLDHVLKLRLLGNVQRDQVLHICAGTLGPVEKWTVDIRPEAKSAVIADGRSLPFADASFAAIMIDPPYSDQYARDLYGTENPRPSWLLREAARVVKPGGRIGLLHVAVPFVPPQCRFVKVYGVTTGMGYRIRAFTIFERSQRTLV